MCSTNVEIRGSFNAWGLGSVTSIIVSSYPPSPTYTHSSGTQNGNGGVSTPPDNGAKDCLMQFCCKDNH